MRFRPAARADVPAILDLLADDDISRSRGFGPGAGFSSGAEPGSASTSRSGGEAGSVSTSRSDTEAGSLSTSHTGSGAGSASTSRSGGEAGSVSTSRSDTEAGSLSTSHTGAGAGSASTSRSGGEAGAGSGSVSEEVDASVWRAFEAIDADPAQELIVAEEAGTVVATCQLTVTPGLSRGGATRMTVEAVRVRADRRGGGIGKALMEYALSRARERDCRIVQLTTDKRRTDAHRFYAGLGFVASHEGMKLLL